MIILLFCWLVGLVCGTGRPDGLSHLGPRTSILQTPSVSEIVYLPDILQTSPVSEIVYLPDIQTHRPISEFIEVPDVGGFDPKEFDVLISDVGVTQLKHEIADAAGIPYHLPATEEEANTVVKIGDCFIYGRNLHTMFPAVVKRSGKAFWVVFLIDTGAPTSYLSAEVSYKIFPQHFYRTGIICMGIFAMSWTRYAMHEIL